MSIVETFFTHQITMKMFHFQTKKIGAHTAADGYLVKYALNFDRFMEAWQGRSGRVKETNLNIRVETVDDRTVVNHLTAMVNFLSNLTDISLDLSAIRDEMVSDLNQLKYLLTFD